MTKHTMLGVAVVAVLALMVGSAFAQGLGRGVCPYGAPAGQGGPGSAYCTGNGPGGGQGAGFSNGWGQGWRGRVGQVSDPAAASEIAALHGQIRDKQWEYRNARAAGADTAALEQEVAALRSRLHEANEAAGLCNGTGPHAYGMQGGAGRGTCAFQGRGMGQRRGQGLGYGRGQGFGRGQGLGYGRGQGLGYGRGQGLGRGPCTW
jgi:hypothetical protein